jgi:hypothetical protein
MNGLTLPEWIAVSRQMIVARRDIHQSERYMQEWLTGWDDCLNALESDMANGLLQGVVK